MSPRIILVAASFLACFAVSQAVAEAKPSVAVLGIEVIDKSGRVDAATTNVAKQLTAELRKQAALGIGPYRLAPNTNKDLLEMKLLSDCSSEARSCMGEIGRELKADRLLYGKLEKLPGGYQVSLNLLDVHKKTMERNTTDLIPRKDANSAGINRWAGLLYNRLTGVPSQGTLVVNANVSDGTVSVDGETKGSLSGGRLRIDGLGVGSHKVRVEAAGHKPFEADVEVAAGETATVTATMTATAIGDNGKIVKRKRGTARPGGTSRILFWSSLVVTGLGATAVTVTGMQVRGSLKDDQEAAVRAFQNANGIELDRSNACADAATRTGDALAQAVVDACDAGKSRAGLTNIFIGATVASAIAAGYFYYRGYIKAGKRSSSERMSRRRKKRKSKVVVTPTVSPTGVGAGIAIEF